MEYDDESPCDIASCMMRVELLPRDGAAWGKYNSELHGNKCVGGDGLLGHCSGRWRLVFRLIPYLWSLAEQTHCRALSSPAC